MGILQNKKDIEQYFYNNWTFTDVHWSGQEFDIQGRDEWVRLLYVPKSITATGLSDDVNTFNGIVKMAIFAKTEFRCFELLDRASTLFDSVKVGNSFTTNALILGTGMTSDGLFQFADIEVEITTH